MKLKSFEECTNLIVNDELHSFVNNFVKEKVPKYFFEVPASSTGKYHPHFDCGDGGLVRHVSMAIEVAIELSRLNEYSCDNEISMDIVIAALLLHDSFKNGHLDTCYTVDSHPTIAADEIQRYYNYNQSKYANELGTKYIPQICEAIYQHMGQWYREQPESRTARLVAMADYISSRKFFDLLGN